MVAVLYYTVGSNPRQGVGGKGKGEGRGKTFPVLSPNIRSGGSDFCLLLSLWQETREWREGGGDAGLHFVRGVQLSKFSKIL